MSIIEKLRLDQVQYVERCSLAGHGEIIQTSYNHQACIGMRTFYDDPMGGAEAIMITGGDESGLMISLENIGNPPALIVSKLVRLVATKILPYNPLIKRPEVGNLLQDAAGSIFVRSQVIIPPGGVTQPAYVCLQSGGQPNTSGKVIQRGDCLQSLSVNLSGISQSFDLELIPEPVLMSAH